MNVFLSISCGFVNKILILVKTVDGSLCHVQLEGIVLRSKVKVTHTYRSVYCFRGCPWLCKEGNAVLGPILKSNTHHRCRR